MAKLSVSLFALLLFTFSNVCPAEELIFPFTVDQNTKNEDINQLLAEKDIQSDKWFMSPPTRLELLTYSIDQYFQKEVANLWHMIKIEKYFEQQYRYGSVQVEANVRFYSDKDMFGATVSITGLGKPKKPMKEVCSEILNLMDSSLKGGGYLYQNTFLRTFIQGDPRDPEVVRIAEKLRKNFLVMVILEAKFDKEQDADVIPRDFYEMRCYKSPEETQVHYSKRSFRLER
jgi:hypothetical protein